jgi:hypothetical protein
MSSFAFDPARFVCRVRPERNEFVGLVDFRFQIGLLFAIAGSAFTELPYERWKKHVHETLQSSARADILTVFSKPMHRQHEYGAQA